MKSVSPLWISRSAAGSMVCSPIAPEAASANGSRLTSTSCGLWSDMIDVNQSGGDRRDQREAVVLGTQRRRQFQEGPVGADIVLVQRQMVDRDRGRDIQARLARALEDFQRFDAAQRSPRDNARR